MWSAKVCRTFLNSLTKMKGNYISSQVGGTATKEKRQLWLLVIPVTTFCLGTWQIFRLQWKVNLIDELERKTMKPPIEIPSNVSDQMDELEYCRLKLHGHFDHSTELLMWPRTRLDEGQGVNTRRGSEPGAFVITRFFCQETGSFILVNRGWVPKSRMNPYTRPHGQIDGDIELTGILRAQEKRAPFSPKNDPEANHWSWRDLATMAQYAATDPIMVDADATTTVPGGPIGGQTKVTLRNEHLQYVFTWYALSLATGYMFYQIWKKTRRR